MSSAGLPELLLTLITAILPILAIGLFIYLVRLAIRREHSNHER